MHNTFYLMEGVRDKIWKFLLGGLIVVIVIVSIRRLKCYIQDNLFCNNVPFIAFYPKEKTDTLVVVIYILYYHLEHNQFYIDHVTNISH